MSESKSPDFDSIKQINPYGEEYWSARALMPKLGYGKKWQNFEGVIKKAMAACTETGNIIELHFTDASKSSPCLMVAYAKSKTTTFRALPAISSP